MLVSEKKLENAVMEFELKVPAEDVDSEYKSAYKKIQKSAKVDGFRKGKVPMNVIESKFTRQADQEVIENLLHNAYIDALKEKNINPISHPDFDFDFNTVKIGEPFSFKVKFEIFPSVTLGEYKKVSATERKCLIKDKDVDAEIETTREKNADISKKEEGKPVENADLVKIMIKRIDNVEPDQVDSIEYKEYSIIAGKSKKDIAFDQHVLGMNDGEEREIEIKYPKKYEIEELSGQKAKYLIKVFEISTMTLPKLDDEFAKDIGDYETLADLKSKLKEQMEKYVESAARKESKVSLLRRVVENAEYDVAQSMIAKEMDALFQKMKQQTGVQANSIEEFATAIGADPETFTNNLDFEAKYSIKSTLALTEIATAEELKVEENEYKEFVEGLAKQNKQSVEEMEKIIEERNARKDIETELLLDKAMNLIYDNASIKSDKAVSLEEFMKEKK